MGNSLRKDRLLLSQNYALYYGHGQSDLLARFDVAIIEPKGQVSSDIIHLQNMNTLVFTYLSIVEVRPEEPIYQVLDDNDFLKMDGKRVENKMYGTYLVNLQSKKWIQYLLGEVHHHLMIMGSDGIFLDTIGDIDGLPEELRAEQLSAMVNLLYATKLLYPNHLFIQNNGLEYVIYQSAPFIDGLCWENPPLNNRDSTEWVEVIKNRLMELKNHFQHKVLLLIEESQDVEKKGYIKARKLAKEFDFLLYYAPNNYVEGVNVIKG
jgi:hypothetical protein